ncbi:MAG TPA: sigma-E factor regulatory protein RseB domain-containing protein, partial [Halomonas sp.]|nr:sigma-E factor regulatory protein RseB domain-containing protein [Halomonas sp.]
MHSRARRFAKRLCLALLLGGFSLAVSAQQVEQQSGQEAAADSSHLDCTALDQQPAPQSGREWLKRSLWAGHCRIYQARAVRVGVDGVRTLALSHEVHDGAEREVLRFLDGDPLTFERRGSSVAVIHGAQGPVPASPDAIIEHLDARYRFRLASDKRIAGRSAVRVDIEPLDEYRYGRRLWLDTETALPLKQELLDERSRVLETFQLVELDGVRLHQGSVALTPGPLPTAGAWQPNWLPPGFDI